MREYIAPILSLIVGVLVLLPTAIGPVARPFVLGWLMPAFVVLTLVSVVALVCALIASSWTASWAPGLMHKAHGIGNFAAVFSLLAAAVFLWSNYFQDISAAPRILNVKVNPVQPEVGKVVEVDLDIGNRTGGVLAFHWELDGKPVVGLRTAYLKMPEKPGTYLVTASVRHQAASVPVVEAGASGAGGREPFEGAATVRVWLDVMEGDKAARPATAAAPLQSIVQICNEGQKHAKNSPGPSNRQGAPRAASSANAGHC